MTMMHIFCYFILIKESEECVLCALQLSQQLLSNLPQTYLPIFHRIGIVPLIRAVYSVLRNRIALNPNQATDEAPTPDASGNASSEDEEHDDEYHGSQQEENEDNMQNEDGEEAEEHEDEKEEAGENTNEEQQEGVTEQGTNENSHEEADHEESEDVTNNDNDVPEVECLVCANMILKYLPTNYSETRL